MRDQDRPGAGLPWRTRPRRRPRAIEVTMRHEDGAWYIERDGVMVSRPGRVIAIGGELEDDG